MGFFTEHSQKAAFLISSVLVIDSFSVHFTLQSRPWPTTPTMMRAWRHVNARMVELYQYMHLIFGTATYAPAAPSSHVTHTAHAIFDLLALRQKEQPSTKRAQQGEQVNEAGRSGSSGDDALRHPHQTPDAYRPSAPPEPYLLESIRPEVQQYHPNCHGKPQAEPIRSQNCKQVGKVIAQCQYLTDEQVSDSSSESESELALADELLGGVIGNSSAVWKRRRRELLEVQEAEAWRRVKGLLQECTQLDTLLQVR